MVRSLPKLKLSQLQSKLLVECLGTFILVLTIVLAELEFGKMAIDGTARTRNLAPIAVGYMLATLIFTFAHVSGAHFNPAVTLGVMFVRAIRVELAAPYIMAQTVGALLASILALLLSEDTKVPAPNIYKNEPEFVIRGLIGEAIFSGTLVTVVLHAGCSKQKSVLACALAVGFCVLSLAYASGGVVGFAFNPAAATGLQLVNCVTGNCVPLMHLWVYWAGPAAGALGASILFKMTQPKPDAKPISHSLYKTDTSSAAALPQAIY